MLSLQEQSRLQKFRAHRVQQKTVNQTNRAEQIEEEMQYWKKRLTSTHSEPERERFVDALIKLRAEQTKLLLEKAQEEQATPFHIERLIRAYYADCARLVAAAAILT